MKIGIKMLKHGLLFCVGLLVLASIATEYILPTIILWILYVAVSSTDDLTGNN